MTVITTRRSRVSHWKAPKLLVCNGSMHQAEIDNWKAIAETMEANGDTSSWFYWRARAIADGKPDPMPNISELMPESA